MCLTAVLINIKIMLKKSSASVQWLCGGIAQVYINQYNSRKRYYWTDQEKIFSNSDV